MWNKIEFNISQHFATAFEQIKPMQGFEESPYSFWQMKPRDCK